MEYLKKKLSSTLREGSIFILPSDHVKNEGHQKDKQPTSKDIVIKLYPKERVVEIQRQHIISLFLPVAAVIILILVTILSLFLLELQKFISVPNIIKIEVALIAINFCLVFTFFSFMYWFYQFYIITNRAIIHRFFFRFGGSHSEEVFLEASPEREILLESESPIFSLLGIEDVKVFFQRPGLGEFVFKIPENPEGIENALEEISLGRLKK